MGRKLRFNRLAWHGAAGIAALWTLGGVPAMAQTFEPTSGTHAWNDDNNWGPGAPQPFPNASGAAAVLSEPTGALTIQLNQPITIGSLTINKAVEGNFNTTIAGNATNTLTFDGGGTILNEFSSVGTGVSIVSAPIVFDNLLAVTQGDNDILRFTQSLSGTGSLSITRNTDGDGVVALNGNNSYEGSTAFTGSAGTNYLVVRLNNANSIPGGLGVTGGTSNITLSSSAVIGLGAGDFLRSIGPGPDQIQFTTAVNSGFAAFGANRVVNLGGNGDPITWGQAGLGQLLLGAPTADATVDFQNPINLGSGTTSRNIRVVDGSAAIDAVISGSISSTGTGTLNKVGGGTLSLTAENTYTGNTNITGGVLRLDHPLALPATTNVTLSGTGRLGLGVGDLEIELGTGPGQLQFDPVASNKNAGFAAYGGERQVILNGGAPLVWAEGSFIGDGGNFILSSEDSDSLIVFHNDIDLNGLDRTFATRQGSAPIDGKITGVISGLGPGSSFTKAQTGTLDLAAANTYEGITTISAGVLLLSNENSIPGGVTGGNNANIVVRAIVGLGYSDLTSDLGYGPGQVSFDFTSLGGFAAYGEDRVVNFGGASAPIIWDGGVFTPTTLVLGAVGADATVDFQNPIDLNGGPRLVAGRQGTAEVDGILSGVISGSGSLQKNANGTLAVTAANTYDGGTLVAAGRLLVNNTTGSGVGSGDVEVASGAALGGTGFIGTESDTSNVTVNSGGRIAPGIFAGRLTVHGDVTFAAGSFFDAQLGGTAAGSEYDQLDVFGAVALNGTLRVSLLDSFLPTLGTTFEILSASAGLTGQFAATQLPLLGGGLAWEVEQNAGGLSLAVVQGPVLAGDYNFDGVVNAADYTVWRNSLGQTGAGLAADGDGNQVIDADDYVIWKTNFGSQAPAGIALTQHVPEPSSLALLGLFASIPWLVRQGRRAVASFDHFRKNDMA